MVSRERLGCRDDAVSPVVGMVLVLGISVVGIAAILYWGLPAIDEMKANVEHRSVKAQFEELDSAIKELVAGTTEKTAKRWQPTLNRGQVVIKGQTDGWVYALETYQHPQNYDFVYRDMGDGDSFFNISLLAEDIATNDVAIKAFRIESSTASTTLQVDNETTPGVADLTGEKFGLGTTKSLRLYEAGLPVDIRSTTIHFQIWKGSTILAEAWYVPTGRVDYLLEGGLGTKTLMQNNGAVFSGDAGGSALVNSPPIPPVVNASGTSRFFGRAVVIDGAGEFAGNDRFDVLVTLYATTSLKSYDCAKIDHSDCAESAKLFVFGSNRDQWHQYLKSTARGFTFTEKDAGSGLKYLEHREGWIGYTLLQSTVRLTVTG